MVALLQLILITVMIVLAMKVAMSEGMLLESLGRFFERKIDEGEKIYDLFYCQWCMSTLQSITAYFFAFGLGILPFEWNWSLIIRYPLIVFGASFISGNLWNLYMMFNQIRERNEAEAQYFKNINNEIENKQKEAGDTRFF